MLVFSGRGQPYRAPHRSFLCLNQNLHFETQSVARDRLTLTHQRFEAGITDTLEITQAQESVAAADLDYITSLFAHNLAKVALARALGHADERMGQFLQVP